MSLLAPLYALGALAIALPVIFHLIQRQPRAQQTFSSLMFVPEAVPTMTRRRRPHNIWLLLLRVSALALLAFAFGRPFLSATDDLDLQPPARRILLVVDTSASMRRDGLWQQAVDHCQRAIDELTTGDRVGLFAFDKRTRRVLELSDTSRLALPQRKAALQSSLDALRPSWLGTNLGQALITAAEALHAEPDQEARRFQSQIVLVTDLQQGSERDGLRSYAWPSDIAIDVRQVTSERITNARAEVLPPDAGYSPADRAAVRVRVLNAGDSTRSTFGLRWATADNQRGAGPQHRLQVPAGSTRVIRMPKPPASATSLLLTGDDHPFDNRIYSVAPRKVPQKLLFLGEDAENPRASLLYYLRRVDLDDVWRTVETEHRRRGQPFSDIAPSKYPLVVVDSFLPPSAVPDVRQYLTAGGQVLFVLTRNHEREAVQCLRALTSVADMQIQEEVIRDYAMLARIDFQNPLFAPLADPRFSDFTKVRFWAHRRIVTGDRPNWRVLARFDNGAPALVEQSFETGRLWLLAAGWQPADSQLAVSTKFVPLVAGMFDRSGGAIRNVVYHDVGDAIALADPVTVVLPDATELAVEEDSFVINEPGVYHLHAGESVRTAVANLSLAESQTQPLDPQTLRQHGIPLEKPARIADKVQEQRRLRNVEIESRQKLWRWLIVATLCVLAAEIWLGGHLARRVSAAAAV